MPVADVSVEPVPPVEFVVLVVPVEPVVPLHDEDDVQLELPDVPVALLDESDVPELDELLVPVLDVEFVTFVASDQLDELLTVVPVVPDETFVLCVVPEVIVLELVEPVPPVEFVVAEDHELVQVPVTFVDPVEAVVPVEKLELEDDQEIVVPVEFELSLEPDVTVLPVGPAVEPVALVESLVPAVVQLAFVFVASDQEDDAEVSVNQVLSEVDVRLDSIVPDVETEV